MTIDLLGRLSSGYVESMLASLRTILAEGVDPGEVERRYWVIVHDSAEHGAPSNSWEWETWIAMHQRILVTALVDWVIATKPKRKGRQKGR